MPRFRRSQGLDLRPTSEWYEKFKRENPDSEELLAEAAEYFRQQELEYEMEAAQERQSARRVVTHQPRRSWWPLWRS